jgi:hypothetical protein
MIISDAKFDLFIFSELNLRQTLLVKKSFSRRDMELSCYTLLFYFMLVEGVATWPFS